MANKQNTIQDFLEDTVQSQQQEVQAELKLYNNCLEILQKFDKELMGVGQPTLERLKSMKRTIQRFIKIFKTGLIDIDDKDSSIIPSHGIELPASYGQMSYSQFCEWKKELYNKGLSRCIDSRELIDSQLEYASNLPKVEVVTPESIGVFFTDVGLALIPYIKDKYTDVKPGNGLTALLIAMERIGIEQSENKLLKIKLSDKGQQTPFHDSLRNLLGEIGTRQALFTSINDFERTENKKKQDQINEARNHLLNQLKINK